MKRMRLDLTRTVFVLLLFPAAVMIASAQTPGDRADKKGQAHLKPVPDVVGLLWVDAESQVRLAGFVPKTTDQFKPDPSATYDHVKATIPAAGTLARLGQEIELQVPRIVGREGIGALGLSDFKRRAGFDLDEGRYEEIYRGADIVLVHHDPETFVDKTTGRTYNLGGPGLYIEPSDGAVLASLDTNFDPLGAYPFYRFCDRALNSNFVGEQSRKAKIEILFSANYDTTICVLTSRHQIAVVRFRPSDNPYNQVTDYQFHYAIFPARPAIKAVGRAKSDVPTGQPLAICEAARQARARNSPAAPGLEAQCRAAGAAGETPAFNLNDLAARGETVAGADPLATELRNQQPDDARRGFDIGMAAAEGQTAPGPGKQKIHDTLGRAEQRGFDAAVAFSIERNRNADLAANGALIAAQDPVVAEARTAESDVFYWLGFDIATGIFGDPALGANGNTATGPGSLKIRDSLSAAGQRGFNAAVKLHLSRNYRP